MFPFPPPPPTGVRSSPGVTPAERGRIVFLAVAGLVVLALGVSVYAYLGTRPSAEPPGPAPGGAPPAAPGAPVPPVAVPPEVEFKAEPLFPEEEASEVEDKVRTKLASIPGLVEGTAAEDPEPFEYLLGEVTKDFRVLNLQPDAFPEAPPVARVMEDPGAFRGRLFRVTGALVSLEKLPYAGPNELVKELRRGLVRTASGDLWTFTRAAASAHDPEEVIPGEGWVRVQGVFYKGWPVADPADPEKSVPSLHLVLQRAPRRDYPPVTVRDIEPAWLEQVKDGTPSEMRVRDEAPFYYLLNLVTALGPDGFEKWVRARKVPTGRPWPPEDFSGRAQELLRAPALHRFQPISCTGYLKRPSWVYDLPPNPGNVKGLWVAFLIDDNFLPVWVYSTKPFDALGFKDGDRVRIEGLFVKRVAYEARAAGEYLQAPVIVAARVTANPAKPLSVEPRLLFVIVGVMSVLAILLVVALVQGRREEKSLERQRHEKLVAKRLRGGDATPPDAPAGGAA